MLNLEEHLDNLTRHIDLVRNACLLLGKRLIHNGQPEFGRLLIARGFVHDASKFYGIEWEYLHAGRDVPKEALELAIRQHQATNDHHPHFWGSFNEMPCIAVAEFACDCYERAQEFGTDLRKWIADIAIKQYNIDVMSKPYKKLMEYIDILLENHFVLD